MTRRFSADEQVKHLCLLSSFTVLSVLSGLNVGSEAMSTECRHGEQFCPSPRLGWRRLHRLWQAALGTGRAHSKAREVALPHALRKKNPFIKLWVS